MYPGKVMSGVRDRPTKVFLDEKGRRPKGYTLLSFVLFRGSILTKDICPAKKELSV